MTTITRWLDVEVSDDIKLNTLSTNLAMVDLDNDNDFKLIVGDFGRGEEKPQVKVFRGTIPIADFILPDLPLGAVGMYTSDTSPKSIPVVAVGFGSCIYIYRNLKIFYKYQVPRVEICGEELEVWKQLIDPSNHNAEKVEPLVEKLKEIAVVTLSSQSKQFLLLESNEQLEYLELNPKIPVSKPTELTCVTTMKMHSVDKYSASCLVVATEDGDVIILDPQNFTAKRQAKICDLKKTPFLMVATGLFIVDYRITVATREKSVCLLKREWKQGRVLFNTDEHIIAIEVMTTDNSIFVISIDNTLACYSKKGMKQWCISLDHRPVAMTLLSILHLGMTMVGVALASGHVQFYDGKALVDSLFVRDVASVIKFGRLGREDHVLIIVTANGNLLLKILKRSAEFNNQAAAFDTSSANVPLQSKPWLIPKKSKLFLEQSTRERENAVEMHRSFQEELNRLRLSAAQTLLEAYTRSDNSVGVGDLEPIRLSAEVEGLGPVFRMTLLVENTSKEKAVVGLSILFHLHNTCYKVYNPYIKVPLLSPGCLLKFPTKIEEIFLDKLNPDVLFRTVTGQGGERSLVKILLLKSGRQTPVLAATVQMPPTDPLMLPLDKVDDLENFA